MGYFVPTPVDSYFEPGLTLHTATPLPAICVHRWGGGCVCDAFDDALCSRLPPTVCLAPS